MHCSEDSVFIRVQGEKEHFKSNRSLFTPSNKILSQSLHAVITMTILEHLWTWHWWICCAETEGKKVSSLSFQGSNIGFHSNPSSSGWQRGSAKNPIKGRRTQRLERTNVAFASTYFATTARGYIKTRLSFLRDIICMETRTVLGRNIRERVQSYSFTVHANSWWILIARLLFWLEVEIQNNKSQKLAVLLSATNKHLDPWVLGRTSVFQCCKFRGWESNIAFKSGIWGNYFAGPSAYCFRITSPRSASFGIWMWVRMLTWRRMCP